MYIQISVVLLGPDIEILTFRHSFQRLSPGVILKNFNIYEHENFHAQQS